LRIHVLRNAFIVKEGPPVLCPGKIKIPQST